MRSLISIFTTLILLLLTQTGYSQNLSGSAHDFSGDTWNTSGEMCIVCHTPHGGDLTVAEAPLWNHAVTGVLTFTLYTSATFDATSAQPDGSSKLCLSCHDGVTAIDSYGGATGSKMVTGSANLGADLSNDHPVSFTYDGTLAGNDGGLFVPSTGLSGVTSGGTIEEDMLFNGKMQCASCHDVHNAAGVGSLLLKSNAGSALCLTCHDK